jgi:hypothetical protein
MASGFFVILDDIAVMFDDVAAMSKLATKKTAGVLGDDLAVGAQRASGFHASRELPVIWAIAKGSLVNKLIILPIAFLLSALWPEAIVPILVIGGLYLSYEGAEKIYEYLFHRHTATLAIDPNMTAEALIAHEQQKIRSAITTDFILSVEIIVIALGTVADQALTVQIAAVSLVALIATVGVYGLVALMVRMDDAGLHLIERAGELTSVWASVMRRTGSSLIWALPHLIRTLAVVGTFAMLLVGGGIFVHHSDFVHHTLDFMPSLFAELSAGFVAGVIVLMMVQLVTYIKPKG